MAAEERFASWVSVHALCVCAVITASAVVHHRVWANSDTWADVSDVAQYVPMVWAAGRTLHGADREGALQLAAAGALTVGLSEVLERVIEKKRPDYKPGDRKRSFPSGHVAKAWFAAAHLQRRYGCHKLEWRCWRGSAVPYIAAITTAVGRVRADRHHIEDVVASAVLAEAWVWLTTDRIDGGVAVAPTFQGGLGIVFFREF